MGNKKVFNPFTGEQDYIGGDLSTSFTLNYPTASYNYDIEQVGSPIEIDKLSIKPKGGTSISGRLVMYDSDGVSNRTVITGDITADSEEVTVVTTFTNSVIGLNKWINWENISVNGSVEKVAITYKATLI